MILPNKILAMDDDPAVLNILCELVAAQGLDLRMAGTKHDAIQALDEGDWAVVLLGQRRQGGEGLELIEEIERRSPGAKTIVVTGWASPETVESAVTLGAYDLVEKSRTFETELLQRVRNASALARERALASLGPAAASLRLAQLWVDVREAKGAGRKGRLLGELVELMLKQIPGFIVVDRRECFAEEQLELVVRTDRPEGSVWGKCFLVHCGSWTSPGVADLQRFADKLKRCGRLGFYVALNLSAGMRLTVPRLVLIDDQALEQLLIRTPKSEDRERALERLVPMCQTASFDLDRR